MTECNFDPGVVGDEINTILRQICESKQKPYMLSVTTGNYTTVDNKEEVNTVIKKADEKLYQKKEERG